MLRMIAVVVSVVALSGCVSTRSVPLEPEVIADYQGSTVVASSREKQAFVAMTAGKAMFGAIGGAAMVLAGNKIVEENEIEDPARYIGQRLLEAFSKAHALISGSVDGVQAKGNDVADLSRQYKSADILLDVQTVNWSFTYFPTDWNSYRVIYKARLRVIDTAQGKVLAEGFCSRVPENSDSAPSREQLLENDAARLKQELRIAADQCIAEFRSGILLI